MASNTIFQHRIVLSMLDEIEKAMAGILEQSLRSLTPEIEAMLRYHLGWEDSLAKRSGKRIRPLMVLICHSMFGGDWHSVLPAAVSVELLHNFSLIHDDIEDQSPLRHHRETIWKKHGLALGINAGDTLFCTALLALHYLPKHFSNTRVALVSRTLLNTCIHLTAGQHLDISFEQRKMVSESEYWRMIDGKTVALLNGSIMIGALLAKANKKNLAILQSYGMSTGRAFQVLDDYLGIWGDPSQTGKSSDSDLIARKKTYPIILAYSRSQAFRRQWDSADDNDSSPQNLMTELTRLGVGELTKQKSLALAAEAFQALDSLQPAVEPVYYDLLVDLTQWLLHRDY